MERYKTDHETPYCGERLDDKAYKTRDAFKKLFKPVKGKKLPDMLCGNVRVHFEIATGKATFKPIEVDAVYGGSVA